MTQLIKPLIKLAPLTGEVRPNYVHISIDPGSCHCGIAVFDLEGKYLDAFTVHVSDGIIASLRLHQLRLVFEKTWKARFGENTKAILCTSEQLPPGAKPVLSYSAGAVLSSGFISADLSVATYIPVQTWKSFVRSIDATCGRTPKGLEALKSIGWSYPLPDSDDSADAILIYLAYVWQSRTPIWVGEGKWIKSTAGIQQRKLLTSEPILIIDTPHVAYKKTLLNSANQVGWQKKRKEQAKKEAAISAEKKANPKPRKKRKTSLPCQGHVELGKV